MTCIYGHYIFNNGMVIRSSILQRQRQSLASVYDWCDDSVAVYLQWPADPGTAHRVPGEAGRRCGEAVRGRTRDDQKSGSPVYSVWNLYEAGDSRKVGESLFFKTMSCESYRCCSCNRTFFLP